MRNREIRTTFCFAKFVHAPLPEASFMDGKAGAFEVDVFPRVERCVGRLLSGSRYHFPRRLNWKLATDFLHSHTGLLS